MQESFRSSPVAIGNPYSSTGTPRSVTPLSSNSGYESVSLSVKSGIPSSSSRAIPFQIPEPATPQNTPANVAFSGFDLYASQRDSLSTFNAEKEPPVVKTISRVESQFPRESTATSTAEVKPRVTFGPISAVQVTEKLEHLLAERKEDSLKVDDKLIESDVIAASENVQSKEIIETSELLKSDSLTNVLVTEKAPVTTESTVVPQDLQTTNEKVDAPQSHGVSPNVPSFQQYFQTQPLAPSSSFFAESPAQQKSDLNKISTEVDPTAFSGPSNSFTHSASSFFSSSQNNNPFFFEYKENSTNANVDLAANFWKNDLQHPPSSTLLGSNFISSPASVPQSVWGVDQTAHVGNISATCSTSVQPTPPPLFYNPAQFQSELHKPSSTRYPHASPFVQPAVNQTQSYFENLTAPSQVYVTDGSSNIFAPVSPVMPVPEPTGSATLSPVQTSINPLAGRHNVDTVPPSFQNLVKFLRLRNINAFTVYQQDINLLVPSLKRQNYQITKTEEDVLSLTRSAQFPSRNLTNI